MNSGEREPSGDDRPGPHVTLDLGARELARIAKSLLDVGTVIDDVDVTEHHRPPTPAGRGAGPRAWSARDSLPALALAASAGFLSALVPALLVLRELRDARAELEAAKATAEFRLAKGDDARLREHPAAAAIDGSSADLLLPVAAAALALPAFQGASIPDPVLRVPAAARWALVTIEVHGFPAYRATLIGTDGAERWASEPLLDSRDGIAVVIPSDALEPGDSLLRVEGHADSGWLPAGRFGFRVVAAN